MGAAVVVNALREGDVRVPFVAAHSGFPLLPSYKSKMRADDRRDGLGVPRTGTEVEALR
jgi:hypothetical protein